jgi:hypothetical protein
LYALQVALSQARLRHRMREDGPCKGIVDLLRSGNCLFQLCQCPWLAGRQLCQGQSALAKTSNLTAPDTLVC